MKKNAYLYDLKKYGSKIMTDKKHFNKHAIRVAFGLFMIVIYCLMGGLFCFTDIFDFVPETIRKIGGGILILYGFWRGYRHFAGIDYYTGQRLDEEEEKYSTYDNKENDDKENSSK